MPEKVIHDQNTTQGYVLEGDSTEWTKRVLLLFSNSDWTEDFILSLLLISHFSSHNQHFVIPSTVGNKEKVGKVFLFKLNGNISTFNPLNTDCIYVMCSTFTED